MRCRDRWGRALPGAKLQKNYASQVPFTANYQSIAIALPPQATIICKEALFFSQFFGNIAVYCYIGQYIHHYCSPHGILISVKTK